MSEAELPVGLLYSGRTGKKYWTARGFRHGGLERSYLESHDVQAVVKIISELPCRRLFEPLLVAAMMRTRRLRHCSRVA
jgi:hypothetical protein